MSDFTEFQTKLKAKNDRIAQSQLATRQQAQAQSDQIKQERTFKEIVYGLQAMVSAVENSNSHAAIEGLNTLLGDIKTSLVKLTAQETPDVSTPIVEAVNKLEAAIKAAAPPQVNVAAPEVSVAAPKVDLSGIQKVLSKDIPRAFQEAIGNIPMPVMPDNTNLVDRLDAMLLRLAEIERATRLKPLPPSSMKVTNLDGSSILSAGLSGFATDTTLTLVLAATSYQVPSPPPVSAYLLLLYNGSDTDMFITFTSNTTGGIKLAAGTNLNIDLGGSQSLFAYSSGTGKVLNVSYKVI